MQCQHWKKKFMGWGCRFTQPRQFIIDMLLKSNKHLTAEDIYIEVHKSYPNIGLTTVYRTLELLEKMGIVHRLDFGEGKSRYELSDGIGIENKTVHHHHHLICTNCRKIINYTDFSEQEIKLMKEIEAELSKKYNFKITTHQIYFYGLCAKCK